MGMDGGGFDPLRPIGGMMKVNIAQWDDGEWYALYVDGKNVFEGHSLYWRELLDALGVEYEVDEVPGDEDGEEFVGISHYSDFKKELESQ
jgi:hypothetical protein